MKDENILQFNKKLLEIVKQNLIKNGYKKTQVFTDVDDAVQYIVNLIGDNKKVGIGGSQTVRSIGVIEQLKTAGNKIITHTPDMEPETRLKIWLEAQQSDFYLASPQAVTLNGEMIFLDAYGNRVSSCIYGPKKVVLIIGHNKIVKDIDAGILRARNFAAPINNIRLNRKNPCTTTGLCENCNSPTRICNILVILYKKPTYTEYEILLVNESLGF
ncbi:MAG: lactate utilization protein [Endomicrobia bacterium]|nr:lactate utilization protein [Endomicrobiia bacterium]